MALPKDSIFSAAGAPPWWVFVLIGVTGGGGVGSLIARPQALEVAPSIEDLRLVISAEIADNNRFLLQEMRLMLAESKAVVAAGPMRDSVQP